MATAQKTAEAEKPAEDEAPVADAPETVVEKIEEPLVRVLALQHGHFFHRLSQTAFREEIVKVDGVKKYLGVATVLLSVALKHFHPKNGVFLIEGIEALGDVIEKLGLNEPESTPAS